MPDEPAPLPALIGHYAAFLRTWMQVTPETSIQGNRAELRLRFGAKTFVAIFARRKENWSLRNVEVRRGEHTVTFTRGELAQAMATLLGQQPMTPTPQAIKGTSVPPTNTTLRERRTIVIRQ